MSIERKDSHPDEAGIEDLLREVGARDEPSAETACAVETAVRAEWQAMLEQRRRARQNVALGIAASIVLAIGIGAFSLQKMGSSAVDVATVARIEGHLLAGPRADRLEVRDGGVPIREGEILQTDARSRVALALMQGVSLRLDHGTTLRFASADRIELRSGALYIDASSGLPDPAPLTVQARAGSVRHVGTQYQVRTHAGDIAVSVREGEVLIEHGAGTSRGEAGESIRVTTRGEISRTAISAQDPSWAWAAEAAPRFEIDNQPLSAFLDWLARETGRRVVYASPQAEAVAQSVKLRGSIEGLDLDTALDAVLSTTQLRRYETEPDAIGITATAAE